MWPINKISNSDGNTQKKPFPETLRYSWDLWLAVFDVMKSFETSSDNDVKCVFNVSLDNSKLPSSSIICCKFLHCSHTLISGVSQHTMPFARIRTHRSSHSITSATCHKTVLFYSSTTQEGSYKTFDNADVSRSRQRQNYQIGAGSIFHYLNALKNPISWVKKLVPQFRGFP